ncbi:NIF-domain-containing protein [Trichodelitschia bisporula]|uniref:Mitochondrial import inner membrane translocase subunit TIM50 n=1 Tax=Trichodelitschia bisporula TaxID=703511 RepID=A0A6G1I8T4_9PEZI|nr:NIF-domain-containing protein [Trichodelitschia bisporula]
MMLSRAAARTFPARIALARPTPAPQSFAAQWARQKTTAPPKKPLTNKNTSSTASRSTTLPSKSSRSAAAAANPTSGKYKATQAQSTARSSAEFNAKASPRKNTAPEEQPGPGASSLKGGAGESSNVEFEGAKSAETNATTPNARTPLPDLRQGIPSTFEQEFLNKDGGAGGKAHHNITESDRDPDEPTGTPQREEGDLPRSAYKTSIDRRRERMATIMYIVFAGFGVTGAVYLGRDWDDEEEERAHPDTPSGWGVGLFYDRIKARVATSLGYYTEPTFPKLLPEMTPPPPYTLVLSLEDLLVHSEWDREHGWRTAKRPGLDYFLRYLSQYYELVLFTSLPMGYADTIIRKMDPYHIIMFPLFREATRYEKGEYVKDLSFLNRPLSRTILIDTKAVHAKHQPENAIILEPWKGAPGDRELVSLIPFLEHVATMGIDDVREAIKSFEGKHIPTEFARREAIAREEFNKQFAAEKAKKPRKSGLGFVQSALGLKNQGGLALDDGRPISEGLAEGKMYSDLIREQGMKRYQALEKEIRENGHKWLKEEAEMEKKMQEEQLKSMKSGVKSFWGVGGDEKK